MYFSRALFITFFFIFLLAKVIYAQKDRKSGSGVAIHYVLKADTADLSGYDIEIHVQNAPHHFQLAMATHHEYDDRFWRYVQNFKVETSAGLIGFAKKDSALWDISIPGNSADISYRIQLPNTPRFAHQPFLSANGGLLGDVHSFMYLVGHVYQPSYVHFQLPAGWQIATGLAKTAQANIFRASSAIELLDCPVLVGHLHQWKFIVNEVPHLVAYLPVSNKLHFDSALLVKNIQQIVIQTARLFGGIPYKNYVFLFEDGVNGALEHANSVTIGAADTLLTHNMQEMYGEIAHEFSHSWNLVRIKPADYTDLNYGPQERSAGLWFSEGLAMFYADLLPRRAGLYVEDKTRLAHLNALISRYYADTGNMVIAPAKVSLASNDDPGSLGDYAASVHLQGELIGSMLDMLIRSSTNGRHSFDDVMRLMFKRHGKNKGFYAKDVEQIVTDVCRDNEVHKFFRNYVYQGKSIDFNKYLRLIGLRLQLSYQAAINNKGQLIGDNRIYIWRPHDDTLYHLILTSSSGCWTKAGVHTGNTILSINDQPIKTRASFYNVVNKLKIDDKVIMEVKQPDGIHKIPITVSGYQIPVTQITKIECRAPVQKLYQQWDNGK
ncbi:hypothetical protein [Mucilaginibacter sp.]|uniref:M61 family metallopeptidase n=1 Tax=Mucilaginibacter sp. TaxID=1882438 RepID=UPI0028500D1D|nr:hypothetical protein [Mucilaginibacter sp.]MDR3695002.1 hypothetical protein [Mucilaginibacter sp.]